MVVRRSTFASLVGFAMLFTLAMHAQENTNSAEMIDFKVRVTFSDGSPLSSGSNGSPELSNKRDAPGGRASGNSVTNMAIRIQAIDDNGSVTAEASPDSQGIATMRIPGVLTNTRSGARAYLRYRVRAFGADIEEVTVDNVEPARADRLFNLSLTRKGQKGPKGKEATVSAANLKVPPKAEKELEKGNKALSENKLDLAKEHINKAIEIYPQFDQAYNMLGVVLLKSGDAPGGKKAFERAVEINDKFARAYVNLAKLSMQDKQYDQALALIGKSVSVEPMNPEAISIACQASLIVEKYEDVAADSRKLHGLPHDGMALCHFAAGVAFTNLKRSTDAITEYNLFLGEAKPNDPLVPKARDALEDLNKQAAAK